MPFPEILRELREKHGITQQQLAEMLNLTKNAVSHYENGVNLPSLDTAEKIADIFDVSVDYLLGRTALEFKFSSLKGAFAGGNNLDDFIEQLLCLDMRHRTDMMKFLEYIRFHNSVCKDRKSGRK